LPRSTRRWRTSRSFSNIVEMEAGGGLVEDVERAAGLALGKFAGQLDALGFAAEVGADWRA